MNGDEHPKKRALREARDRSVESLVERFAKDEIGLDEFERRVDDAYQSTSVEVLKSMVGEDATVVASLTTSRQMAPLAIVPRAQRFVLARAVLGNVERRGTFRLDQHARVDAVLGNVMLDFRDVKLPSGTTEISLRAVLGNIEIIVPSDLAVECEGHGILGNFEGTTRTPIDDGPGQTRLRLTGSAVCGSIEVRTRPPRRLEQRVLQLRDRRR